jgi:hypothetical protein
MATVTCSNCGELLAAEGAPPPPADAPCPQCGRVGQNISVALRGEELKISAGVVGVTIVDYQRILLQDAAEHIKHKDYSVTIVVAHVACEITAQQGLTRAFTRRGISELEHPVRRLFTGFNLANERIRAIYEAVSGDAVHQQSFWQALTESAERRNRYVHSGTQATEQEAQNSLTACTAFVEHVSRFTPPPTTPTP